MSLRRGTRSAIPVDMPTKTTILYFDCSDPRSLGWAWRTRDEEGDEESGPVEDDAIVQALDAIMGGESPAAGDLCALRSEYEGASIVDTNGVSVGELFPC